MNSKYSTLVIIAVTKEGELKSTCQLHILFLEYKLQFKYAW